MSELQVGLLIIGAVTIVGVIAYNKYQDLKYRRLADKSFASSHDDALLDEGVDSAKESSSSANREESESADVDVNKSNRIEPTLVDEPEATSVRPVQSDGILPLGRDEDAPILFTVNLSANSPLRVDELAASFDGVSQAFSKPARIAVWSNATQCWVDSTSSQLREASGFRAGIQLVDRQGPVAADELARFSATVVQWADGFNLVAETSDIEEAHGRAKKLDEFCCDVDIQIVLHLVSTVAPFPGTKIRAIAEAEGFHIDPDGVFRRVDESGLCLFSITDSDGALFRTESMKDISSRSLSFQFDLPRVPGGIGAFDQFCTLAGRLSTALGARLIDDNQVAIGAGALKSIRTQVEQVQTAMNAAGFPPGTPVALTLFS